MSVSSSEPHAAPSQKSHRRARRRQWMLTIVRQYWVVLALCLVGSISFPLDLPISRWMHTHQGLKVLHQPLQVAEALADGFGIAVILISLFIVAVPRRRELVRVLCCVLAGGLCSNIIKLTVARMRPRSYPGTGLLEVPEVWDTFHGWLPLLLSEGNAFGSRYQSFPSGHTTAAFTMAVSMTRLFPAGGWWFTTLALMVALQRIETGAHYFTDTCFGAALGLLVGLSFQEGTRWSRWFDRYESQNKAAEANFDSAGAEPTEPRVTPDTQSLR